MAHVRASIAGDLRLRDIRDGKVHINHPNDLVFPCHDGNMCVDYASTPNRYPPSLPPFLPVSRSLFLYLVSSLIVSILVLAPLAPSRNCLRLGHVSVLSNRLQQPGLLRLSARSYAAHRRL